MANTEIKLPSFEIENGQEEQKKEPPRGIKYWIIRVLVVTFFVVLITMCIVYKKSINYWIE